MQDNLVYNKKAIIEVTKEFTFDSCHQLKEYIGACARLHGHTYKLQVTLRGTVDEIGMVFDFKNMKTWINDFIIEDLDHYNLNDKLGFNTTAENMVVYFYDVLANKIKDYNSTTNRCVEVRRIRLWETPTSFATYEGRNE